MRKFKWLFLILTGLTFGLQAQENDALSASLQNELYITKTLKGDMSSVYENLEQALKDQKFGIITEIDMDKTLREKIGADIKPYKILGVCSPKHAHAALQAEPNIGVFLPCKVVIKQLDENQIEVVAVNPMLMMQMLKNPELNKVASEVTIGLQKAIGSL